MYGSDGGGDEGERKKINITEKPPARKSNDQLNDEMLCKDKRPQNSTFSIVAHRKDLLLSLSMVDKVEWLRSLTDFFVMCFCSKLF